MIDSHLKPAHPTLPSGTHTVSYEVKQVSAPSLSFGFIDDAPKGAHIKRMKAAMLPYESMRLTDEQLLAKLEKEQEKLQSELAARKAKLNARTQRVRSRLSARERKTDTRRKILVGAMMLKLADQHPETKDFILKHLDDFLDHPRDRDLFDDLPPTPHPKKEVSE